MTVVKGLLDGLSRDLGALVSRLSDEAIGGVVQREVARVVAAERVDPAPLVERAMEGVRRATLDELGALASDLRKRLVELDIRTAATDERVTDERIRGAVDEATNAAAERVYRVEFEGRVLELEEAFARYGDPLDAVRRYVEQFTPGGLPVLRQERDELELRVAGLSAERDTIRARADELQGRLEGLEGERRRHLLQSGVAPDDVTRRLAELEARQRELASQEALTSERDRLANQVRELSAEIDRWRQQATDKEVARVDRQELERVRREVGDADANRARMQDELSRTQVDRRRLREECDRQAAELVELAAVKGAGEQREKRLQALADQLEETTRDREEARTQVAQQQRALVASQAEARRLGLALDETKANEGRLEAEWRKAQAAQLAQTMEARRASLDVWAEHEASSRSAAHVARADRADRDMGELRKQLKEATDQVRALTMRAGELEASVQRLGGERDAVASNARFEHDLRERAVDSHRARLEQELAEVRERAIREALADAEVERQRIQGESDRLAAKAEAEQQRVDDLAEDLMVLQGRKGASEEELEGLRRQVGDLASRTLPSAERIAQLEHAVLRADDLREADAPDEKTWLLELGEGLRRAGFAFHPRLLEAFHTSLKIAHHAPLVVLAGISGTGKSELPRLYADLGGLPFLPLAVQPSWDSPHDLFGFFNYTDGRLKAEPLAQLLRQMSQDEALRESPCLVLLDEMNLARVEYYFAELLSKLEARRGVRSEHDPERRRRASVQLDAGPGEPRIDLYLDERVLFVGTMNEDESTLTLSDKVLDRACVLTFPAPRKMRMTEQREAPKRPRRLSWEAWQSWHKDEPPTDIAEKLNAINGAMERLHRPFGHRLFRAIHAYVANHPNADHAWDDQFAMKILPRLRGLECGDRAVRSGLEELANLVPPALQDAFGASRDREFFAWVGSSDLYRADE